MVSKPALRSNKMRRVDLPVSDDWKKDQTRDSHNIWSPTRLKIAWPSVV